jgi:hypothetical protein
VPPSHGGSQWFDPTTTHQIKSIDELNAFFVSSASNLLEKKRINFLALQAINLLPSYVAQPSCVKVRCRAFLMPARIARLGPATVKNWALQALIMSSSTQSIRATQTTRCRAFKRVIFYIVLVKFVKSSAFFSYSPNGSCRPNFLGCGFF